MLMQATLLLSEARERAGLSQRALAERAKTSQSVVARIELGITSPSWETLSGLIMAAGFALDGIVRSGPPPELPDLSDTERILALTPRNRLREIAQSDAVGLASSLRAQTPAFNPDQVIQTLAHHDVQGVVIGAVAARLRGAPRLTAAVDFVPSREEVNLERLSSALRELGARVFTDGVPEGLACDLTAPRLARGSTWLLVTLAGRLDLRFSPEGERGYVALMQDADRFWFGERPLHVASIRDQIRMKEATGRPRDRDDMRVLRALLARRS